MQICPRSLKVHIVLRWKVNTAFSNDFISPGGAVHTCIIRLHHLAYSLRLARRSYPPTLGERRINFVIFTKKYKKHVGKI